MKFSEYMMSIKYKTSDNIGTARYYDFIMSFIAASYILVLGTFAESVDNLLVIILLALFVLLLNKYQMFKFKKIM